MASKIINLLKIISGYFVSRITRKVFHWGLPVSLSVEPTNRCNLQCPECPGGMNLLTRSKGFIDHDFFNNIIDRLSPALVYLNLYFQGEPYMHPGLANLITFAKSKNIFVSASTNGHFLTPENAKATVASGLDRLVISLDGADAETYVQYRIGGKFDQVISGIQEIVKQKRSVGSKNPNIVLQFLVLRSNQHQVKMIRKLGRDLEVDKVEIKTAQFYNFVEGNPLMPDDPRYSRYKIISHANGNSPRFAIRNRLPDHCFRMWSSCVITWDGTVVPCCFDKDAKYRMGNAREQDFNIIWKNEDYNKFRKNILFSRKSIDICNNCTEGAGTSSFL